MCFKSPVKSRSVQHNTTFIEVGLSNTITTSVPRSTWILHFCKRLSDCNIKMFPRLMSLGSLQGHHIFGMSHLTDCTELGLSLCSELKWEGKNQTVELLGWQYRAVCFWMLDPGRRVKTRIFAGLLYGETPSRGVLKMEQDQGHSWEIKELVLT